MEISTDRIERYGLTEREREVLSAVAAGWSNSEIATNLCISEHTVKSHIAAILAKTGWVCSSDLAPLGAVVLV